LVEVLEVVEDQNELGILMVDPGSPICGSSHRVRARESRLLTTAGRKVFRRNIIRVAEGLALCHDAGIVHGAVSEHAIFSHVDDNEDYPRSSTRLKSQVAGSAMSVFTIRARLDPSNGGRSRPITKGSTALLI
jgi:hypothetical protein